MTHSKKPSKAKTAPRREKPRGGALISTAELCGATGYGKGMVGEWKALGIIKPVTAGKWEPVATLGALVRKLREKDAGTNDRQRKNKAEADEAEARAMEITSQTCLKKEAKLFWSEERTKIRATVERADFLTPAQRAKLLTRFAEIKTGRIGE